MPSMLVSAPRTSGGAEYRDPTPDEESRFCEPTLRKFTFGLPVLGLVDALSRGPGHGHDPLRELLYRYTHISIYIASTLTYI